MCRLRVTGICCPWSVATVAQIFKPYRLVLQAGFLAGELGGELIWAE